MSFLDQFSFWQVIVGFFVILAGNTVLFKLLIDWNQSQPADDGEPLVAPPGPVSLAGGELEKSPSFATASVPLPNRPRRRKHLQSSTPAGSSQPVPDTDGQQSKPPAAQEEPPVPVPAPAPPAPEPVAASSLTAPAHPEPVEAPLPVIAFNPEPERAVIPAPVEPAVVETLPTADKEAVSTPPEPTDLPILTVSAPAAPAAPAPEATVSVPGPAAVEPTIEPPSSAPVVNIAPESPATIAPPPAGPDAPAREDGVPPSSDLVLAPPAPEPAAHPTAEKQAPITPPAEASTPPAQRPQTTPIRSSFRRAVAPARLFLTREFSSVRIRSRQLNPEPASTPAPEPGSVPFSPEPALRSSEPATASEETPSPTAAAPEPIVEPTPAAKAPEIETPAPAEPAPVAAEAPATTPEPEPTPAVTPVVEPEPAPAPVSVAPPEPEPEPVPVPAIEAAAPPEPEPVPEPAPIPAIEEAVTPPAPTDKVADVIPTSGLIFLPDPSETLPVVDINPEQAILPPPSAPEEERPIHPEPSVSQPPIAPFIPIPIMASVQPVTGERATAQLTLSLEVASLQLTPAFKLGSVQLRPLSNVVSLQLGAGVGPKPADNPLAANISFEIQSVQAGGDGQIQSLVLKPLPAARADTTPHPKLQVDAVQLTRGVEAGPIQITPASATSTAVQLLTTYAIAGIDFTPNFEIGTMRLEPATRTVMLRLNQPGGAELPPAFEIANVQVGDNGQISMVQLTPTTL